LAVTSSTPTVLPRQRQKEFTTRRPSSSTRRCCVRLSPIAQYSLLLPPVGVWAVVSPSVGDHPLRPPTRRRLGEPLPHQLPDGPQPPPSAPEVYARRSNYLETMRY